MASQLIVGTGRRIGGVSVRTLTVAVAVFSAVLSLPGSAHGWKLRTLHAFCARADCADGASPGGPLLLDPAGNLFGTTQSSDAGGVVFELTPSADKRRWTYTIIHKFCTKLPHCLHGNDPEGLIMDVSGNLYGTAGTGGEHGGGAAFELTPAGSQWNLSLLYSFCSTGANNCTDGAIPGGLTYAGVTSGALYDGVSPLFGTAGSGGYLNRGTIFKLVRNGSVWSETVIHRFKDGASPGQIVADGQGNLFGNLSIRGKYGSGQTYEFPHDSNKERRLHEFCAGGDPCADGSYPSAALTIDGQGILVGVTSRGGIATYDGVAFTLDPKHRVFSAVYDFCSLPNCADGRDPFWGLIADGSDKYYGTTFRGGGEADDGVAFQLTQAASWSETVVHVFCSEANCEDGALPDGPLVLDSSGNLYGVTFEGGRYGRGTVYELSP